MKKTTLEILCKITGEEGMYIEHGMIRGSDALEAMEVYAAQFKQLEPDISSFEQDFKELKNYRPKELTTAEMVAKLEGIIKLLKTKP